MSQQNAPFCGAICSWKVEQDAWTLHLFFPAQRSSTTAILWFELQLLLGWKPAEQLPVGVPKEAKSIDEITSPAGQPMLDSPQRSRRWWEGQVAAAAAGHAGAARGRGSAR